MREIDWITQDYLEFFCQQKGLMVGCKGEGAEVWISAIGTHPPELSSRQIEDILKHSVYFEVRVWLEEELNIAPSKLLSRKELEQNIQRMMN